MNSFFKIIITLLSMLGIISLCRAQEVEMYGNLNIVDCGAVGNGVTDNTAIIQQAIDACSEKQATVVFPAGVFYTRPLFLKSNVTLKLEEGTKILGSPKPADYTSVFPNATSIDGSGLIYGRNVQNITITGTGIIDGQGYSSNFGTGNDRPKLVHFVSCKNILVEGVTLQNSAFWTSHYLLCDGIIIRNIIVLGHANHNDDGIDIDSRNVEIYDCYVDTDDDGICLKSDRQTPCGNVLVRNCTVRSNCNALKLGTAGKSGFKYVEFRDCTVYKASKDNFHNWRTALVWAGIKTNPTMCSGIAIESVDGGVLEDVQFHDITMTDVQSPIFIRLGDRSREYSGKISRLRNVTIYNVTATAASKIACSITGMPEGLVDNITIRDVTLNLPGGGTTNESNQTVPEKAADYPENRMFGMVLPAHVFYVRHAQNIFFENVKINLETADKRPPYVFDDVQNYNVSGLKQISKNKISTWQQNGKIFVFSELAGKIKIEVINMTGKTVSSLETSFAGLSEPVTIDSPSTGLYVIVIHSSEGIHSLKQLII